MVGLNQPLPSVVPQNFAPQTSTQGMAEVRSVPGRGTSITGRIPIDVLPSEPSLATQKEWAPS